MCLLYDLRGHWTTLAHELFQQTLHGEDRQMSDLMALVEDKAELVMYHKMLCAMILLDSTDLGYLSTLETPPSAW